jgi:hypothetical protein
MHFIGAAKPWCFARHSNGQVAARGDAATVHLEYVQLWWDLHDQYVKPKVRANNRQSTPSSRQLTSDFVF